MKVLISSKTNKNQDVYELRRLRKSIKGACELANIPYVSNELSDYDILHVLDLNQDLLINDAIDNNKPIVCSALMAENDPYGKMCFKNKKGTHLKPKAIKTLNNVNLVLVANSMCKDFLINEGIKTEIEILPSGVNLSRFVAINDIEKNLCRRYFGILDDQKIILSVGQYDSDKEYNKIIEIAKKCPEYTFIFLGKSKKHRIERFIAKLLKQSPRNLILSDIIEDDVYRSAMINADIYLSLKDIKYDNVTLIEAMAAKTRIITMATSEELGEYEKYVVRAESINDVVNKIKENINAQNKKELDSSYEFAKNHSLAKISSELKSYYTKLISK